MLIPACPRQLRATIATLDLALRNLEPRPSARVLAPAGDTARLVPRPTPLVDVHVSSLVPRTLLAAAAPAHQTQSSWAGPKRTVSRTCAQPLGLPRERLPQHQAYA